MTVCYDGLLVLDKPPGISSRAAVDVAVHWFPPKTKIGHTGTLDPLATGVLVLCVGSATRLAEYVQRMDKTYRACVLLGARSDTDDADGTVAIDPQAKPPEISAISTALEGFLGVIEQVPPAHSAAKVSGRRAYALARRGEEFQLASRQVAIYGIELLSYEWPLLELEVRCGKGTYIRSLARDLGQRLGCGGLIRTLRRTRVGPFAPDRATALNGDVATARSGLLPSALALAELPSVKLAVAKLCRFQQGQAVSWEHQVQGTEVAVFDEAGGLQAVAEVDHGKKLLRPSKVFCTFRQELTPHP